MGWPGPLDPQTLPDNAVNVVIRKAPTNVAVLLDRGCREVQRILVPVGGGPHSRLAIRLAYEIAEREDAELTVLYCFCRQGESRSPAEVEEMEDELLLLRETIEDELGSVPARIATRVAYAHSVPAGILAETCRQPYDLVAMGASEEWPLETQLFGSIDDQLAIQVPCSVLLVRRHEPAVIAWVRRQAKRIERDQN